MNNLFRSLALSLSLVASFAHALAAEPVAGTNYEVLKNAQPTSAPPGKVEVIEFFLYTSKECYKLEPTLEAFVKKEGDRILLKRVPFTVQDRGLVDMQLYYSLMRLEIETNRMEKLMLTLFNEIQTKNTLRGNHEEGAYVQQADFLATQGVDKWKFISAYQSRAVGSLVGGRTDRFTITKSIASRPSS